MPELQVYRLKERDFLDLWSGYVEGIQAAWSGFARLWRFFLLIVGLR